MKGNKGKGRQTSSTESHVIHTDYSNLSVDSSIISSITGSASESLGGSAAAYLSKDKKKKGSKKKKNTSKPKFEEVQEEVELEVASYDDFTKIDPTIFRGMYYLLEEDYETVNATYKKGSALHPIVLIKQGWTLSRAKHFEYSILHNQGRLPPRTEWTFELEKFRSTVVGKGPDGKPTSSWGTYPTIRFRGYYNEAQCKKQEREANVQRGAPGTPWKVPTSSSSTQPTRCVPDPAEVITWHVAVMDKLQGTIAVTLNVNTTFHQAVQIIAELAWRGKLKLAFLENSSYITTAKDINGESFMVKVMEFLRVKVPFFFLLPLRS